MKRGEIPRGKVALTSTCLEAGRSDIVGLLVAFLAQPDIPR